MDKGRDEERRFLENLDGLLAGGPVPNADDSTEDHASAMEFARKLADLSEGPSPEFQQQLKARLLMKLTERDVAERQKATAGGFWGFLDRLMPRSPVWRTAAVSIAVVLVTVTVAWQTGVFSTFSTTTEEAAEGQTIRGMVTSPSEKAAEAQPMAPKAAGAAESDGAPAEALTADSAASGSPVLMQVVSAAEVILEPYGQTVTIDIEIAGNRGEILKVGPLPPTLTIVAEATQLLVRTIPTEGITVEIAPEASVHQPIVWDQKDDRGMQVPAGWYSLRPGTIEVSGEFEITNMDLPHLPRVLVQYPQGTMKGLFEPGLTSSSNGVSLTLERVVLHAQGIVFTTYTDTTDGILPEGDQAALMTLIPAPAQYTAGDITILATHARIEASDTGVRLTWDQQQFLPVPADAAELVIIIDGMGDRQGRWEFRIPLQD
jgi:hypothetical protein